MWWSRSRSPIRRRSRTHTRTRRSCPRSTGSDAPVSDSAMSEPSLTVAGVVNVAVGGTLLTTTVAVYSVAPPSLSLIRPRTVRGPSSLVAQLAVSDDEYAPKPPPSPQSNAYVNPAVVSALDGSNALLNERSIGSPSSIEPGAANAAVGATFVDADRCRVGREPAVLVEDAPAHAARAVVVRRAARRGCGCVAAESATISAVECVSEPGRRVGTRRIRRTSEVECDRAAFVDGRRRAECRRRRDVVDARRRAVLRDAAILVAHATTDGAGAVVGCRTGRGRSRAVPRRTRHRRRS